jgi:hypothetical protein
MLWHFDIPWILCKIIWALEVRAETEKICYEKYMTAY